MQDGWKTVWSIPYVSVAFFPSLKQNFIVYHLESVILWIDFSENRSDFPRNFLNFRFDAIGK